MDDPLMAECLDIAKRQGSTKDVDGAVTRLERKRYDLNVDQLAERCRKPQAERAWLQIFRYAIEQATDGFGVEPIPAGQKFAAR